MAKIKFSKTINQVIKINQQAYIFQNKADLDFSLSENPLETFSNRVKKAIVKNIFKLTRYPTEEINQLKTAIAKNFNLRPANIALGNGLEQIIDLIFRLIINPGDGVIIPLPAFFLFEKAAVLSRTKIDFVQPNADLSLNLDKIKQTIKPETKIIIFSNPNNPTGQVIPKKELLKFISDLPKVLIVIDEANIEFGGISLINEVKKFKNLIVLRTFSKAFGLAGLRVGFCAGPNNIINLINNINQPVPLNLLACIACKQALQDKKFIQKTKRFTNKQRNFLIKSFKKIGFKVFPTQTNNILIKTEFDKFTNFLQKNNISVVDASCFRGLGKGFFRISPRTAEKNIRLVNLLKKYYK